MMQRPTRTRIRSSRPRLALLAPAALILALGCGVAMASAEPPPQSLVRQTTDAVLDRIRTDPDLVQDRVRLYRFVDETILPHFDFQRMSRRVLGKAWRRASDDQRGRFVREFQSLLVRTYATALASYRDQVVEYLPHRYREKRNEFSIRTQIVKDGSPPIPIKYEMYMKDGEAGGWKVYDVAIDGVSLVLNFRSTFKSEIRSAGLDALIERLGNANRAKLEGSQ